MDRPQNRTASPRRTLVLNRRKNDGRTRFLPDFLTLEDRVTPAGIIVTGSHPGGPSVVNVYETDTGTLLKTLNPFDPSFTGGVSVATGDLTGDGVADVVVGAGFGGGPQVKVYDGTTWELLPGPLGNFFAYSPDFRGGVQVAVGDVNKDGFADIITAAGKGGSPHVKAFSGFDGSILLSYYAYAANFTGGVNVAAGDLNGDGKADIVTGAGPSGSPHVKVFNGIDGSVENSFLAYAANFRGGVKVAVGNVEGDGDGNDIVTGTGPGAAPHVKAFRATDGAELQSYYAFDPATKTGADVATIDTDRSADFDSVLVSSGKVGSPLLRSLGSVTTPVNPTSALAQDVAGGSVVAGSLGTVLLKRAGLGSYFEGEAKALPPTKQGVPPDNTYQVPNTPTPNFTDRFLNTDQPVQTTDWWSPIANRSTNHPGKTGWDGNSNNNPTAMVADPVVYGLRQDQTGNGQSVQFGIGQNINPRAATESYYQLGNTVTNPAGLVGSSTRVFYRFTPFESNGKMDVQVGAFDPTVNPGPDNAGDGSNAPAQRSVPATNIAVDDYSDWGATFQWSDPSGKIGMTATGMVGNPFTYYTKTAGSNVELYFGRTVQSVALDKPITFKDTTLPTRVIYNNSQDGVLVIAVPQIDQQRLPSSIAYYAFFGPAGSTWNISTRVSVDKSLTYTAKAESDLGGKGYFSSAVLPYEIVQRDANGNPVLDNNGNEKLNASLLELFRQHAYAFPTNLSTDATQGIVGSTQVLPSFDPATAQLTTEYRVYTQLMENGANGKTNKNGPLFTLYPAQYKNLDAASAAALKATAAATYESPKGSLKLLDPTLVPSAGSSPGYGVFGTTLTYQGGLLPALPSSLASADNDTLLKYLARVAANPYNDLIIDPVTKVSGSGNFNSQDGAYNGGKRALRIANLLPLFDMVSPNGQYTAADIQQMRNVLLDQVKRFVADFFDATDYKFFLYDTVWDTMLPYPDDGFLAIQKINDHHFHFGYFIKAAALIARYDPQFVSDAQFGPMLTLLAKDVANTDRTDLRFPFLRNFQPYLGHDYADGVAGDDQGNNQESSSEAMNFSTGLVMLGEAMMSVNATAARQLRDAGVYLFTTQEQTIGQNWFNADQDNFPSDFTDTYDGTTLTANIDAKQTTIAVQANGTKSTDQLIRLPAVVPFTIQIDNELLLVTKIADGPTITTVRNQTIDTYQWTVIRGAFGTTPKLHWIQNDFDGTKKFPTTDDFTKKVAVKSTPFRATTLAADLTAAATTVTVASAAEFPDTNGFSVGIGDEVVKVTAGAGTTTWTVVRGQEKTKAVAHTTTDPVRLVSPTAMTAATIIQGGALNRSNFFAGDAADEPATNFVISWLPVTASSLYLDRYRTKSGGSYARAAFQSMLNMERFLFSSDPGYEAGPYLINVGGKLKGTPGQGGEYPGNVWAYQAFSDPAGAIAALRKYVIDPPTPDLIRTQVSPGGFDSLDQGESVANTFAFANSLATLGEIDPKGYATSADGSGYLGTTAVFKKGSTTTYVAYNYDTKPHKIAFRTIGGNAVVTIDVPAQSMITQVGNNGNTKKVVLGPPQGLPNPTPPANRFFLRSDVTTNNGDTEVTTFLSKTAGANTNALVLPVSPTDGSARGPDFFPGPIEFKTPMSFEISGITGSPVDKANTVGGPRTAFSIPVLNNLFRNPVDGKFNMNSALVVVNVAYFAKATDTKPTRVEVWSQGPQGYNGDGNLVPGFVDGRATWQPYISQSWFSRAPGDEKNWFIGDYPEMTGGKVRITIWTDNANVNASGKRDLPQSQIGIRTNSAPNQYSQAFVDIPYKNVQVSG